MGAIRLSAGLQVWRPQRGVKGKAAPAVRLFGRPFFLIAVSARPIPLSRSSCIVIEARCDHSRDREADSEEREGGATPTLGLAVVVVVAVVVAPAPGNASHCCLMVNSCARLIGGWAASASDGTRTSSERDDGAGTAADGGGGD